MWGVWAQVCTEGPGGLVATVGGRVFSSHARLGFRQALHQCLAQRSLLFRFCFVYFLPVERCLPGSSPPPSPGRSHLAVGGPSARPAACAVGSLRLHLSSQLLCPVFANESVTDKGAPGGFLSSVCVS